MCLTRPVDSILRNSVTSHETKFVLFKDARNINISLITAPAIAATMPVVVAVIVVNI